MVTAPARESRGGEKIPKDHPDLATIKYQATIKMIFIKLHNNVEKKSGIMLHKEADTESNAY